MKRLLNTVFFVILTLGLCAQQKDADRYWSDFDFSDSSEASIEQMENKLIGFLYQFTNLDEKHFDSLTINGLDFFFSKAKANMRLYGHALGFALRGYTGMGRDAVTDYLLNYPQLVEGEITMEEGMRLDSIAEPYQKVRVGAKAPNYSGLTIDGKQYSLLDSEARYIIVFFWSSDCEYCHDFLSQIRRKLNLKSDFELVTFSLAENIDEVRSGVKKLRLPGYHFYDPNRWDSKPFLDYHVTTTPTVFLLNADKTIVCKPYDWEELKDWLRSNE